MPPRLLSLLSMIETALFEEGQPGGGSRSADYRNGIARMTFPEGVGSIVLHNFQLADGQLCVRVEMRRSGVEKPYETAIYPQSTGFNWKLAACKVARDWVALEPAALAPELAESATA